MRKVAVVGCAGSGKSYVSRTLGRIIDAPVTHLDAVFYDDAWNELPMDAFAAAQRDLVARPAWILDGNYNTTLRIRFQACDTVVFADVSTAAALYGLISRRLRHGPGHHADGVHNRIHWELLRYVLTYRRRMRPRVLAKIAHHAPHAEVVVLTSRRRARRWLRGVEGGDGPAPAAGGDGRGGRGCGIGRAVSRRSRRTR